MDCRVTVIVASLSKCPALDKTIESCAVQTGIDVELVVFLKNSDFPLSSPNVENAVFGDYLYKVISGDDKCIADAWNSSLQHASGDFVCFLGAGDYFLADDSVADLFSEAVYNNAIDGVFFGQQIIEIKPGVRTPWPMKGDFKKSYLMHCMCIPHASSFWPLRLFKSDIFDGSFKIALDYEFSLRVMNKVSFCRLNSVVAVIEAGGVSNTPRKMLQVIREDVRARRKNNLPARYISVLNIKRVVRWIMGYLGSLFYWPV